MFVCACVCVCVLCYPIDNFYPTSFWLDEKSDSVVSYCSVVNSFRRTTYAIHLSSQTVSSEQVKRIFKSISTHVNVTEFWFFSIAAFFLSLYLNALFWLLLKLYTVIGLDFFLVKTVFSLNYQIQNWKLCVICVVKEAEINNNGIISIFDYDFRTINSACQKKTSKCF